MPIKEKLEQLRMQQDKDSLISNHISEETQLIIPSVTVELVQPNKETILIDKLPTCDPCTRQQKSLEILEVASTSNVKDLSPYWNDLCGAINSKLLLPVGTDYAALDSTLYDTWLSRTVDKSWFSTNLVSARKQNLPKIFSQSSMSFPVECTDLENTVRKSRKIKIFLTSTQKAILKHWFGVSRYIYNQTIQLLKDENIKPNWKGIKSNILNSLPNWSKTVPYQIKSIAIKDACEAVSKVRTINKHKKPEELHKAHFRSRKNSLQSCYIPKSAVTDKGIYHTILGNLVFKECLPNKFGDCRLVSRYGEYYLTLPFNEPRQQGDNQARVVALDPGIRTFITFFSEDSFGKLGNEANLTIYKLCLKLDSIISKQSKVKAKQRYKFKKTSNRVRSRIQHLVDELHKKVAKLLVDNFDIILLPTFETKDMVKKANRKIRSKSARQMLTLSHYKFKQFLKHKAYEHNKVVLDVNEAYTSKTVSWTGEIIHNLGGSRIITSKIDKRSMDRDLNGARGIFLRALVDTPFLRDNLRFYIC